MSFYDLFMTFPETVLSITFLVKVQGKEGKDDIARNAEESDTANYAYIIK